MISSGLICSTSGGRSAGYNGNVLYVNIKIMKTNEIDYRFHKEVDDSNELNKSEL